MLMELKMSKMGFVALILLLVYVGELAGQGLYMPRNVKKAYAARMRSMDGKPGERYFQNKSAHDIRITLNPPSRRVMGSEDITYTNNSPSALAVLYLRFEMNVHAPEAMRERIIESSALAPAVEIDEFAEDGKVRPYVPLLALKASTFNAIQLAAPLPPGGSRKLSFKWHYDLAQHTESTREGVVDETTFYLGYFYPRVAVLDDVNNFDGLPHMLAHEFYGDFNDYSLSVTVPKNFVVWATGELQNADEVLQPRIAERLKRSYMSDDVISVASLVEMKAGTVTSQSPSNTWRWKATNVPDVAFGISDHYIWDAGSVVVDKQTGRRASAQAAYDEPATNFRNMVTYIKAALDYASNDLPGVPYPFPKMTIFRGFADMEFPMMANDSSQTVDPPQFGGAIKAAEMQQFIATHEILHTYFPFYMGINERAYGFMEEGWTTAFEYPFNQKLLGKEKADRLYKEFRVSGWANSTNSGGDIPIMTFEGSLLGATEPYGANKYGRAALGYLAMRELLGEVEFKRVLHIFMDRWHGKHPIPWDMYFSFNDASGKNLNWFWNAWFFQPSYIDLGISAVGRSGSATVVSIKNSGGCPAPFDLVVTYTDGSKETIHQTPAIWEGNLTSAEVRIGSGKDVTGLVIDGGIYMDAEPADNKWGEPK